MYYRELVKFHAPRFAQNLVNVYFKNNLNTLNKMPANDRMNLLVNSADALNEEIFRDKLVEIKSMMHMGVLQLQHLMDKLYSSKD